MKILLGMGLVILIQILSYALYVLVGWIKRPESEKELWTVLCPDGTKLIEPMTFYNACCWSDVYDGIVVRQ